MWYLSQDVPRVESTQCRVYTVDSTSADILVMTNEDPFSE